MQVGYHLCENGDLERREGEFRLCDGPAAKQPGITDGRIGIMSNERDRISEYFEARGVSRGEFEALKRFGDYEQLSDGTLMRMEGDKEFRIYREDSGWLLGRNGGRGVIVTSGFSRVLSEAHDRVVEKVKKDPDYLNRLREKFKIEPPVSDRIRRFSILQKVPVGSGLSCFNGSVFPSRSFPFGLNPYRDSSAIQHLSPQGS